MMNIRSYIAHRKDAYTLLTAFLAAVLMNCSSGPEKVLRPSLVCHDLQATTDRFRIVKPSGGEVFRTGEPCTVLVKAETPCNVILSLVWDTYDKTLPGQSVALKLPAESLFIFTVPPVFPEVHFNQELDRFDTLLVEPVSDSCLIKAADYSSPEIHDYSDCYSAIAPGRQ